MRRLKQFSPDRTGENIYEEAKRFFEGRSVVHDSMRRLANRLDDANIAYAVMGGMAGFIHGSGRPTDNLDVLLSPQGFLEFGRRFVPALYTALPGRPRRFTDRTNPAPVNFFLAGHHPGIDRRGPVAYPDPVDVREARDGISYVNLATFIEMKLAAGRFQDLADVVSLIAAHHLDDSFANDLHPSLRSEYLGCLEETSRQLEFEMRNG